MENQTRLTNVFSLKFPTNFQEEQFLVLLQVLNREFFSYSIYITQKSTEIYIHDDLTGNIRNKIKRLLDVFPNPIQFIPSENLTVKICSLQNIISKKASITTAKINKYEYQHHQNLFRLYLQVKKVKYSPYTILFLKAILKAHVRIILYSGDHGKIWNMSLLVQHEKSEDVEKITSNILYLMQLEASLHLDLVICNKKELKTKDNQLEKGITGYDLKLADLKSLIYHIPSL